MIYIYQLFKNMNDNLHPPNPNPLPNFALSPINPGDLPPQTKKSDIVLPSPLSVDQNSDHTHMSNINTKFYPQKKQVCKGEINSNISQYLKPLSNSPIVDYYSGLGVNHQQKPYGFFSPEHIIPNEAFNKFNSKTMPIHKEDVPFYQMNNKMLFDYMNQNDINFNMSPGRLFAPNMMMNNNLSNISKSGNGSFGLMNDNQSTFISKTLAKRFDGSGVGISMNSSVSNNKIEEENIDEGKNEETENVPIKEIFTQDKKEKKQNEGEFYMLSFDSDEKEEKEEDEEEEPIDIKTKEEFDLLMNNGGYAKNNNIGNLLDTNVFPFKVGQYKQNVSPQMMKQSSNEKENENDNKGELDQAAKKKKKKKKNKKKKTATEPNAQPQIVQPKQETEISPQDGTVPKAKKKSKKKIKKIDPALYINLSVPELCKNILNLSKDQAGCRHIQTKIDEDPDNTIPLIFQSILPCFIEVSMDTFGNYLIQKLFAKLSNDDFYSILTIISPHILELGANPHGTRVIQALINYLKTEKLIDYLISIIKPVTVPLIKELNGTHIIQKISEDFPNKSQFIYDLILKNAPSIATHRHGCCVLQRYIVDKEDEFCKKLVEKLLANFFLLAVDQFGNYIIQSIMKLNVQEINNSIANKMIDNILYYSKHKFSSNIVEKCFDYCDMSIKTEMVKIISEEEAIKELIIDEHGNYVVQKVLACSPPEKQLILFKYIVPMFNKLRSMNFGEKIIGRLLLIYPAIGNMVESNNLTVNENNLKMMPQKVVEKEPTVQFKPVMNTQPTIINNNIIMINSGQGAAKPQTGFKNYYGYKKPYQKRYNKYK